LNALSEGREGRRAVDSPRFSEGECATGRRPALGGEGEAWESGPELLPAFFVRDWLGEAVQPGPARARRCQSSNQG